MERTKINKIITNTKGQTRSTAYSTNAEKDSTHNTQPKQRRQNLQSQATPHGATHAVLIHSSSHSQTPLLSSLTLLQRARNEPAEQLKALIAAQLRASLSTPEADARLRRALAALEEKAGQALHPVSLFTHGTLALVPPESNSTAKISTPRSSRESSFSH